jgi:hypothetical protein
LSVNLWEDLISIFLSKTISFAPIQHVKPYYLYDPGGFDKFSLKISIGFLYKAPTAWEALPQFWEKSI